MGEGDESARFEVREYIEDISFMSLERYFAILADAFSLFLVATAFILAVVGLRGGGGLLRCYRDNRIYDGIATVWRSFLFLRLDRRILLMGVTPISTCFRCQSPQITQNWRDLSQLRRWHGR